MAGFDPDVFGATPAAAGYDEDIFNLSAKPIALGMPAQQPAAPKGAAAFPTWREGIKDAAGDSPLNRVSGAVRGAGSIGATLLAPFDYAEDALTRRMTGQQQAGPNRNEQRRTDMTGALQSFGADPESTQFKTGKLLAEIGGTSGIGPAAAAMLSRIPGATAQAPALLNAIRTGGMTTNAPVGASRIADMGTRVAGGAINGALTAGAVNPLDADEGMMIGGLFPPVTKALGAAGDFVGGLFRGAPAANPTKLQTARESMEAGYVIPPSMINPSFKNRVMESTSGKHATAQIASTRNQELTDTLTRKSLPGLATDAPLTFETMAAYRKAQHQAGYEPLRQVGVIPAGQPFNQALDDIANQYKGKGTIPAIAGSKQEITDMVAAHKSNGFDAGDAVDAIRVLREDASALFRSTNAGDKAKAKATKAIADAYEDAIEEALKGSGQSDLLGAYRAARQNIAKSGTAEKAIREGAGTVDARIFARELQKGKPLTGEQLTIAKFANTFDKAAQPPHLIGSPAVHNLNGMFSTGAGAAGAAGGAFLGGPVGAGIGATLGAAYPYVVPPLVRARMFSKGAQQGLLSQGANPQSALSMDELLPYMYRSNGLLGAGGGQ